MLKQMGYDDAKIEKLINSISAGSLYNKYVEGLQSEPDVRPDVIERKKAA